MEPLRLIPRQPADREPEIENWDDDDFFVDDGDDLAFRNSAAGNNQPPSRRDSISSHRSMRSELESLPEEDRQVHVPDDDEKSTMNAISAAANMGIPLPKNVPSSALLGGTIKRLGGRKIKRAIEDDWDADLELPEPGKPLAMKPRDGSNFPDSIRQVSSGSVQLSPTGSKKQPPPVIHQDTPDRNQPGPGSSGAFDLDKFRDDDDDDDFFGDGSATIKVSKTQGRGRPIPLLTPPTPLKAQKSSPQADDDIEQDLELPSDGKLRLSTRRDIPKTPAVAFDDVDWGEGSLGTRYGGTRRDGRSNRSSSASALSPSIASSITAESEDETFDGLILPPGPVNFEQRLKLRRKSRSHERIIEEEPDSQSKKLHEAEEDKEDFCAGLDLGDATVFDSRKLSLHRNIKVKDTRPDSPSRPKASASITFTNKPVQQQPSRLPRLSHERTQSSLEPVSESGGPIISRPRRSQSRMGHSAQSSVSSQAGPTTPVSSQSMLPATPRRGSRDVATKASAASLRTEPTTTNAQLLRLKRSMPAMKPPQSPAKTTTGRFERPPSRTDTGRPLPGLRPKTPVERTRQEAGYSTMPRRQPPPFLPAGSSQSHHATARSGRSFRRHDSEHSIDFRPGSRTVSRSTIRSPSPRRVRASEKVTDTNYRQLNRPRHQRTFGVGNELDGFDDLPISRDTEDRYVKQPVAKDAKTSLRSRTYQNAMPERSSGTSPVSPFTTTRPEYTPSFARDTAASRIARETSMAQRAPTQGPLAPLTTQRVAQLSTRGNLNPNVSHGSTRSKKRPKKQPQLKPHLISNLNSSRDSKSTCLPLPPYLLAARSIPEL